mmetsp:Transcript_8098/g.29891  ORF Transcript_8098/g.29891 Transcript_8098/m.29891 type:complete len:88 (+) Transcript_8098:912-1175(+)
MTAVVYQCADRAHSSQQWPLRTASTCSSDWNDLPMSSFMDSKVVPTVIVHMQADGTFKTLANTDKAASACTSYKMRWGWYSCICSTR